MCIRDREIAVTETATGFVNERQRVEIDLVKSLDTDVYKRQA